MSRPADVSSKTVSARVPMADYINFLKEASEAKTSISDWLIQRIYKDDDKEIEQLKNEMQEQQEEQQKTENLLAEASGEIANLKKKIGELQKERDSLSKSASKNQAESDEATKEAKKLTEQIKSLQKAANDLKKEGEQRESRYAGMMEDALKIKKNLEKDLATAKANYTKLIEKNKELRTVLQNFHDKEWSIPRVLKMVDENLQMQ